MKDDLLKRELGAVHGGFVRPAHYFELILYATARRNPPPSGPRTYIQWTALDRSILLTKLKKWWEEHGQAATKKRHEKRFFDDWDADAFPVFMRGLWNVVRQVLLPQARRGSRFGKDILQFVEDVRESGLPVGSVLPATLFVRPVGDVKEISSLLRREFAHADVGFCLSALRGLNHWAELSHPLRGRPTGFPAIPVDLLREVGTTVAARRPGVVRLAIQASVWILKRLREGADRRFRDSLLDGLNYLFPEATYSDKATGTGSIKYEEIPAVRCEAVELAKCLSDLGGQGHEVVRRWLESARTDPLPEVRRAAEITLDTPDD